MYPPMNICLLTFLQHWFLLHVIFQFKKFLKSKIARTCKLLKNFLNILVSRTSACNELAKSPPHTKLVAVRPILSLIGHTIIVFAFQFFVFKYMEWQPW